LFRNLNNTGGVLNRSVFLAALLTGAALLSRADTATRVVHYHTNDIVAIRAKMRYTTLIEVPSGEKIMEAATGDKDFWIIEAVQNYCFLHPAKTGIHSNLNLITDKGNVYSFTLDEIGAGGEPDLKVLIEPSDSTLISSINSPSKFVPASDVEAFKTQAQAAQIDANRKVEQFRSQYPTKSLKFDYVYRDDKPFDVQAIYHDADFTYVKSTAAEKFAVYEVKDGKPNSISFELRDGTYVIPKVVDHGYLRIGKKRMDFHPSSPCAARLKTLNPSTALREGQEPHPHCAEQTTLPGQDSAAESEPESMANLTSSQPRFGGPDTGNYLAKHLLLPALFSSMLQLQIRPAQTTPYSFAWYPARACFGGELQSFWHERFFGFGIVTGHPCIGKSHALPVAKGVKQHPLFPAHPEIKQASHRFFIAS
jgi:type IV secretion system protein VirB9